MNLQQLEAAFREDANDTEEPRLWSVEALRSHFNEAEEEAAIRMRLLPGAIEIDTAPAHAIYPLTGRFFEIVYAAWAPAGSTRYERLYQTSIEQLDSLRCDWRTERLARPECLVHTDSHVRLAGVLSRAGTLQIEGYRLPRRPLRAPTDSPEINEAHHRHLVNWALYRAFSKVDAECFDPNRAALAHAAFERYFGLRPDAELNKWTRRDLPHHNTAIMP